MAERWADIRDVLEHLADSDLRDIGRIPPAMVAFDGDLLLFLSDIRPFPRGGLPDALIELLALALPLGADRIAYSFDGRAWSLHDPIPPVLDGVVDLRARVHTMLLIDGHRRREPSVTSVVRPYHLAGDVPVWREPFEPEEPSEGWVTQSTIAGIRQRASLKGCDLAGLRGQAARCERLGHVLRMGVPGMARLVADKIDGETLRLAQQVHT